MTGALLRSIPAHYDCGAWLQFSPIEENVLAFSAGEDEIHVWDIACEKMIRSVKGTSFGVLSPDGRTIATARTPTRDVNLVDVESGEVLVVLPGDKGVFSVSFSVDGSKLATGSNDGTCKVLTPHTLHPVRCTLHPTPYTLHPTSYTLNPVPYTLHPTPYTLHPTPYTLHPTPYTLHPTPYTLHPTP